jgi:hypothetical protein
MAAPLVSRALGAARRDPVTAALYAAAAIACLYVVAAPLAASRYPAMTDFPFHAAQTSILRHYWDADWGFREQFRLQPIAVPYLSMYALGALLMLVFPPVVAVKIAGAGMLLLLPLGLAVLFRGLGRSPLLGLLGLGLVWCTLTHWGFLNFVGALGLFAMAVGLALLVVERPTRARRAGLAVALVALFFTHIFRFPMGLAAVVGAAAIAARSPGRFAPVLLPLAPSAALFAAWLAVRPASLGASFGPLALHPERLQEIPKILFASFADPAEARLAARALFVLVGVFAACAAGLFVEGRHRGRTRFAWIAAGSAAVVPVACALGFLVLFLWLPMQIGDWWYVYPREATSAVFLALGAAPDLPRSPWLKVPVVAAILFAVAPFGALAEEHYARFGEATDDYHAITRRLPPSPKLLYLVFDHAGSARTTTPFIHLPAYVQAERGGFLSFHFAIWNASPITYRDPAEPGAVVPPPTPPRWEWRPELFDVETRGAFFDWFLVRRKTSPDRLFAADPTIERVDHVGTWWLYRRAAR